MKLFIISLINLKFNIKYTYKMKEKFNLIYIYYFSIFLKFYIQNKCYFAKIYIQNKYDIYL